MRKLMLTWPIRILSLPALIAVLILMSLSGCKQIVVLNADQTETFVRSNQVFRVPVDGVFMPDAKYQRYRRAVADRILEQSAGTLGDTKPAR